MRYAVTLDGQSFGIADTLRDAKVMVMDAQIKCAEGRTFVMERHAPKDWPSYHDEEEHFSIGYWHVFTHNGYHLIELLRLPE